MKTLSVLTFLLVLLAPQSWATDYYVDNTHGMASDSNAGTSAGAPWLTIGKCSSTIVAGDTCNVLGAGTYDARITEATSGSMGSPITYLGGTNCVVPSTCPKVRGWTVTSGTAYVTIKGFEVTLSGMSSDFDASFLVTGTDHVRVEDTYIHDTCTGTAGIIMIRSDPNSGGAKATWLYVGGNKMLRPGCASNYPGTNPATTGRSIVMQCWCDDTLVENNDMEDSDDFIRMHGSRNVIRGNYQHNSDEARTAGYTGTPGSGQHIDGMQSFCTGSNPAAEALHYTLYEGNRFIDNPTPNTHTNIVNATDACGGSTTFISRYNILYRFGSSSFLSDDNEQAGADHHKFYNNTVVDSVAATNHVSAILLGVTTGTVLNNIFMDAIQDSEPYQGYALRVGDSTSVGNYNLFSMSSGSKTWSAPAVNEANGVRNSDPLFRDKTGRDFRLQSGSPARNAGGHLTTVHNDDTSSGTSLILTDAHFFQPGWAGTQGDYICVGASLTISATTCTQITSINYGTNTATISPAIARSDGDKVWHMKDSNNRTRIGGSAPDMGALDYDAPVAGYCC